VHDVHIREDQHGHEKADKRENHKTHVMLRADGCAQRDQPRQCAGSERVGNDTAEDDVPPELRREALLQGAKIPGVQGSRGQGAAERIQILLARSNKP